MPLISHKTQNTKHITATADLHLPLGVEFGTVLHLGHFNVNQYAFELHQSFLQLWDLDWLWAFLLALSLSIRFYGLMPFSGHWALNATFSGRTVGGSIMSEEGFEGHITRAYWLSCILYLAIIYVHLFCILWCSCWLFSHFYAWISISFTSIFRLIYFRILRLLWIFNNFFLCLIWHPVPMRAVPILTVF